MYLLKKIKPLTQNIYHQRRTLCEPVLAFAVYKVLMSKNDVELILANQLVIMGVVIPSIFF